MDSRLYCKMPITLDVTVIDVTAEGCFTAVCRKCGRPLELHQPDEGQPDHLLGTCAGCGGWHMIDAPPDQKEAYVVALPEFEQLQAERIKPRTHSRTAHAPERARRDFVKPDPDRHAV
jgi:hypothetical protein